MPCNVQYEADTMTFDGRVVTLDVDPPCCTKCDSSSINGQCTNHCNASQGGQKSKPPTFVIGAPYIDRFSILKGNRKGKR